MTGANPRLLELRRRVQADPASMAFAQLAEEYRRSGDNDEAVGICRAGLAYHPDYLSARVTLSRALIELGRFDEAHAELSIVLAAAPDNLPANRAMAEIYQQRGQMTQALEHYRRALQLAQYDPALQQEVTRIENVVSPPPPPQPVKASEPAGPIEDLFDFDSLLQQLGGRVDSTPVTDPVVGTPAPSEIDNVQLRHDDADPLSVLEQQLRVSDETRTPIGETQADRDQRVMAELEDWLLAIVANRPNQPSA